MSEIIAKRVSNYELFYDLVFVLATSSLTGLLHGDHIGLREILTFITANLIIMTLWINETIYLNKYGERDLLDIFTIIASMFVVGQLSLNFSHDFKATGPTLYYLFDPVLFATLLAVLPSGAKNRFYGRYKK